MNNSYFKKSFEDWGVEIFSYGMLLLFAVSTILPFINILAKSFSVEWAVVSGKVGLFPVGFQLETMKYVITAKQFLHSMYISVIITILGSIATVFMTGITAYPLSKRDLPGSKLVLLLFVFTMFFGGGLIPNYLLVKNLKMLNTLSAVIIPGMISVFNMLIVKNNYEAIPESLEESAKLDGASNMTILFRIVIPLSLPVFATITLFTAVGHWNDYFGPMLYLTKTSLKPLSLYLRDLISTSSMDVSGKLPEDILNIPLEGVQSATIFAATVPILLVYPFLQKYFIKGMLVGSVKG